MFVYGIKVGGLLQADNAYELVHAQFGVDETTYQQAYDQREVLIIWEPERDGELFFEDEYQDLSQAFSELSRKGLQFTVFRQRFGDQWKEVADYSERLKKGRKMWREERLRVEAAGESLQAFLAKESTSEDMEVLRPLFPKTMAECLKGGDDGVLKGAEILLEVFPSLKRGDRGRILYAMQLLHERRNSKWKSRSGCAWVSIYFLMATIEMFAIYAWLADGFDWYGLLAAPAAFVIGLMPGLGSIFAYQGATDVWGWENWSALMAFFWYYLPILFVIGVLAYALSKGSSKLAWNRILGRSNDKE